MDGIGTAVDGQLANLGRSLPASASQGGFPPLVGGSPEPPTGAPDDTGNPSPFLIQGNKSVADLEVVTGHEVPSQDICSVVSSEPSLSESKKAVDLPTRLGRYAAKVARSGVMGKWIQSQPKWQNYHPVARVVAECGSYLRFRNFFQRDQVRLVGANSCCKAMLCPFCAGLRGARHLAKAIEKIRAVMGADGQLVPYLWTGTIRDEVRCRDMYQRLRGYLSKMLESRRNALKGIRCSSAWAKFEGGIVSFEVKRGKNSGLWHIHFHAIVLGRPGLDPREFQQAWSDLVGYWAQSDLRPFRSTEKLLRDRDAIETDQALADDLQEVFKYAVKCSDMTTEDNFEAFRELQGQRLIRGFGNLYNVKFADEDVLDDVDDLVDEPYIDLFFNLIAGKYVQGGAKMVRPGSPLSERPVACRVSTVDGPSVEKVFDVVDQGRSKHGCSTGVDG